MLYSLLRNTAERVGFEPTVTKNGYNGFRDRPDRPLRHLSVWGELYIEMMHSGKFLKQNL